MAIIERLPAFRDEFNFSLNSKELGELAEEINRMVASFKVQPEAQKG